MENAPLPPVPADPKSALDLDRLTRPVRAFLSALEREDEATRGDVARFGDLAMRVGRRAGVPPHLLPGLGLAAILRDIGEPATPDAITSRPSPLTLQELYVIREHALRGCEILGRDPALRPLATWVRAHHERPDGDGYPDGLEAEEIPVEAGIIAVCDGWEAMTHDRPYRARMAPERAAATMREQAGRQWDRRLVGLLLDEVAIRPSPASV
jgi:HD-GYP domain-containing protein (c-di-GMP phosphodiesterase class II)